MLLSLHKNESCLYQKGLKLVDALLQDHVLIELKQTGLKKGREEEQLIKEDDPFLVVHPNYTIDG